MTNGLIFDIKRFSIHDGPGIRSTVFLKGCPLSCSWCHNPESQSFKPELVFRPERCLVCGECVDVCPHGSAQLVDGIIQQDRALCQINGACVEVCYPGAREIIGTEVNPQEVLEELIKDEVFYQESGGGVTFSGGEPLAQPDFLEETLKLCKNAGLATTLDTCGSALWANLERQLPFLDLVLYDLKILDDKQHQLYTGRSNREILENYQLLIQSDVEMVVRRPVIPGVNNSQEQINQLGVFIKENNGVQKIDLLPYHALSADKYLRLGRGGEGGEWQTPSPEDQERILTQLRQMGFEVSWGG
ncbi:MAG: glycyl-radical enzyme activating protein [Chloroflexi bacterium]|nr:glycyl-radical enzyme activating protein [Chloroflexota bacterium]